MSDEINNEERGEEETPSLRQEENGGVRSISRSGSWIMLRM